MRSKLEPVHGEERFGEIKFGYCITAKLANCLATSQSRKSKREHPITFPQDSTGLNRVPNTALIGKYKVIFAFLSW